jgi:hypothetical protein
MERWLGNYGKDELRIVSVRVMIGWISVVSIQSMKIQLNWEIVIPAIPETPPFTLVRVSR